MTQIIRFLEELATSSSFGDKTFSLLMLTPGADFFFIFFFYQLPCTCRNSLSRALVTRRAPRLQVLIRVGKIRKITYFGLK